MCQEISNPKKYMLLHFQAKTYSGKKKTMYFGKEISKFPEYIVWIWDPVLDPWHFTWVFENRGRKSRHENKNRTSNPGRQTKTGHQIPSVRPKPGTKSRPPRSLDAELRAHSKASETGWDWQKLSFVLELKGAVQDEELSKAQSKINSALQSSLQAGYSLFETNLQNDQLQHRRYLLTSSGDEAKARAAIVASLEALTTPKSVNPNLGFTVNVRIGSSSCIIYLLRHCLTTPVQKMHAVAWKLVNGAITEICPTWRNGLPNKKLSTASPNAKD